MIFLDFFNKRDAMKLLYKHNNIVKIIIIMMSVLKLWSKQFFFNYKFWLVFWFPSSSFFVRRFRSNILLDLQKQTCIERERQANSFSGQKNSFPKIFFWPLKIAKSVSRFCCSSIRPWQRTKFSQKITRIQLWSLMAVKFPQLWIIFMYFSMRTTKESPQ